MEIGQVREFVRIADEGSYTKASIALNVSQPALSKHMSALERELGSQLLARNNLRTALTPAGKVFYDDAQGILQAVDAAFAHQRKLARSKPMHLCVESFFGYPPSDDLLVALESNARRTQLHLELERRDITMSSSLDDVRAGAADMCLVSHLEGPSDELDFSGLESRLLTCDALVAIVRDDHPLANRGVIAIEEIGSDVVWTCTAPGVRTYFSAMETLLRRGGANPRFMPVPWTNAQQLYNSFAFFDGGIHVNLASVVRHSVPLLLQGYKVLRITDKEAKVPMFCHWRATDDNPAIAVAVETFESTIERLGENPWG